MAACSASPARTWWWATACWYRKREGDLLACDADLLQGHGLRLDESLLTGESMPVNKLPDRGGRDPASARLSAGTLVVQGDGVATVVATGVRTALGRIGGSLAAVQPRPSRLQDNLARLGRQVAVLALLTCLTAATAFCVDERLVDRRPAGGVRAAGGAAGRGAGAAGAAGAVGGVAAEAGDGRGGGRLID
jgi:hypothetical protein